MSDGQTPQHGGQQPRPADDNPYQRASSGWTGTDSHPTQPIQPTYPGHAGLPLQQPTQTPRGRTGRGRTGLAAAVVATSLLVGGGAGVGGEDDAGA